VSCWSNLSVDFYFWCILRYSPFLNELSGVSVNLGYIQLTSLKCLRWKIVMGMEIIEVTMLYAFFYVCICRWICQIK
jgi:hypothetical protein